jgi:hypothetical protein
MTKMLIWLGAGQAPPDLVNESREREEAAVRLTERLWPARLRARDEGQG